MATLPTRDERIALVDTPVTLNGQRARIVGLQLEYPRVVNVHTGEGYEWSWPAVARVVARGGAFTS